jgi:hypothetical protein
MKMKKIALVIGIAAVLTSCGGTDYKPSANAMCKCMSDKEVNGTGSSLGQGVDYASCVLDVMLEERVDIMKQEFGDALNDVCPNLTELHKDYMKTASDL